MPTNWLEEELDVHDENPTYDKQCIIAEQDALDIQNQKVVDKINKEDQYLLHPDDEAYIMPLTLGELLVSRKLEVTPADKLQDAENDESLVPISWAPGDY
jgi:hypothetical protein